MQKFQSIRLFKNPFLERLTHIHPMTPFIFWIPVIGALYYYSFFRDGLSWSPVLFLTFLGLLVWTFTEYVLHRFVFHYEPKTKWGERIVYLFHGIHHEQANDPSRLVMPLSASIPLASLFYFLFYSMLGGVFVLPFFAGFLMGYLLYDYTHFAVHFFTPKSVWGRYIKKNHMDHHYVNQDTKWGVSSPLWDFIFGSFGNERQKTRSPLRQ